VTDLKFVNNFGIMTRNVFGVCTTNDGVDSMKFNVQVAKWLNIPFTAHYEDFADVSFLLKHSTEVKPVKHGTRVVADTNGRRCRVLWHMCQHYRPTAGH